MSGGSRSYSDASGGEGSVGGGVALALAPRLCGPTNFPLWHSHSTSVVHPLPHSPPLAVGEGSLIGPNVSVGAGVRIGRGVRLSNCFVMSGAKVLDCARVTDSIVGWDCHVGRWVSGEGVRGVGYW